MKLSSLPAKIARRFLRVAENLETGRPAKYRRFGDCYATVRALHRVCPGPLRVLYDIGANEGHWAETFAAFYPQLESAILFEPSAHCAPLLAALRFPGAKIDVVPLALGREVGSAVLIGDGASASLRPATTLQEQFFPGSMAGAERPVEVTTLDRWVATSGAARPDIIKLDVQGAEGDVLAGATATLATCRWLVTELSAVPLYEGQQLGGATLDWLEKRGWRLADIGYRWLSPNGHLLQFDAILTRDAP